MMENKRVGNQKHIKINKDIENYGKKKIITKLNLNGLDSAAAALSSGSGLSLYIYLAKNDSNYEFNLSNKAFENWCGKGRSAYNTAVKELIDKGFLVKAAGKDNYIFYDIPKKSDK